MGQYFSKEWTEDVTTGSPEAPEVEKSPNESTPIQKFSENFEKMYEDFKSQNESLQIQVEVHMGTETSPSFIKIGRKTKKFSL